MIASFAPLQMSPPSFPSGSPVLRLSPCLHRSLEGLNQELEEVFVKEQGEEELLRVSGGLCPEHTNGQHQDESVWGDGSATLSSLSDCSSVNNSIQHLPAREAQMESFCLSGLKCCDSTGRWV
jgi:hypothetical protein